jgi:F-type H+-transporting ATPase subunit alpha
LDDLPVELVGDAETAIQKQVLDELPVLCQRMEAGDTLEDSQWRQIIDVAGNAVNGIKERTRE